MLATQATLDSILLPGSVTTSTGAPAIPHGVDAGPAPITESAAFPVFIAPPAPPSSPGAPTSSYPVFIAPPPAAPSSSPQVSGGCTGCSDHGAAVVQASPAFSVQPTPPAPTSASTPTTHGTPAWLVIAAIALLAWLLLRS